MPISSSIEEKSCLSRVDRKFGRFSYHILDFSSLSTEIGCAVEGPDFELCGHVWQLRIFPGGSLPQHKTFVSYYLASKSTKDARASYRLAILNQIGGGENKSYSSNGCRLFKAKNDQVDGWGRDKFIRLSELLDPHNGLNVNDSIHLEVEIIVHGEIEHLPQIDLAVRSVNQHTLEHAMMNMWNDKESSDIKLLVGPNQQLLYAHRFILVARSRVFRAMLTTDMSEGTHGYIVVDDVDIPIMTEVLHFLYTDIPPTRDCLHTKAIPLLVVALKYDIPLLVEHCENFLTCRVDARNAVDVLVFADAVSSLTLRSKALYCIAQNASSIMQTKEFAELDEDLTQEAFSAIEKFGKHGFCAPKIQFIEIEPGGKKKLQTSTYLAGCNIM